MRILIIPVTKDALCSITPKATHLVHHLQVPPTSPFFPRASIPEDHEDSAKQPLAVRITTRGVAWATTKWDEMSMKPDKTFTKKLWIWGEKLKDVVDKEEWFLKNLPGMREVAWENIKTEIKVPIHHPAIWPPSTVEAQIKDLLKRRKPYHGRGLTVSLLCLPFSCLFMVFPGPNVPLAWNLFRLYSHWRALEGIRTLERLERETRLLYVEDALIDRLLKRWQVGWEHSHFIPTEVVEALVQSGVADASFGREVDRAIKQVKKKRRSEGAAPQE